MQKNMIFPVGVLSILILAGCSSNDELVENQKAQEQQLLQLGNRVDALQEKTKGLESVNRKQDVSIRKIDRDVADVKKEAAENRKKESEQYRVKQNDTLYKVAKEHGLPVGALKSLNPQLSNPNRLLIGEIIRVK